MITNENTVKETLFEDELQKSLFACLIVVNNFQFLKSQATDGVASLIKQVNCFEFLKSQAADGVANLRQQKQ